MILPFSTKLNGKPTFFIERIWQSILRDRMYDGIAGDYQYYRCLHRTAFGNDWDEMPIQSWKLEMPKKHTIREDKNARWYAGRKIHFLINNRSKNAFQFLPVIDCVSTQEVFMSIGNRGLEISIDDKFLYYTEKELLAKQDGFDALEEFENYFLTMLKDKPNLAASFKIIHWTNFKY